jgi:hypothetical protein
MSWACPACGRTFARTGQTHVCSDWTVERHLEAGTKTGRALFERFVELVRSCGDFEYAVTKTTVTFKGRRRGFAGARPKEDRLVGYFDIPRRVDGPQIRSVAPYGKRLFVHHFSLDAPDQLGGDFAGWIREAYEVGEGHA